MSPEALRALPQCLREIVEVDRKLEAFGPVVQFTDGSSIRHLKAVRSGLRQEVKEAWGHSIRGDRGTNLRA